MYNKASALFKIFEISKFEADDLLLKYSGILHRKIFANGLKLNFLQTELISM